MLSAKTLLESCAIDCPPRMCESWKDILKLLWSMSRREMLKTQTAVKIHNEQQPSFFWTSWRNNIKNTRAVSPKLPHACAISCLLYCSMNSTKTQGLEVIIAESLGLWEAEGKEEDSWDIKKRLESEEVLESWCCCTTERRGDGQWSDEEPDKDLRVAKWSWICPSWSVRILL